MAQFFLEAVRLNKKIDPIIQIAGSSEEYGMVYENEIPIKEIKCCKTVDIVPTIINMLGKKPHKSVVGDFLI